MSGPRYDLVHGATRLDPAWICCDRIGYAVLLRGRAALVRGSRASGAMTRLFALALGRRAGVVGGRTVRRAAGRHAVPRESEIGRLATVENKSLCQLLMCLYRSQPVDDTRCSEK